MRSPVFLRGSVAGWDLWTLPRRAVALILGVEVAAVLVVGGVAARWSAVGRPTAGIARQSGVAAALALMYVVHVVSSSRHKDRDANKGDTVDVTTESSWHMAVPILLPLYPAVLAGVLWELLLSARLQHTSQIYKAVYNRAIATVFQVSVAVGMDLLLPTRSSVHSLLAARTWEQVLVVAWLVLADFVVNLYLSATIAAASGRRFRDVVRGGVGVSAVTTTGLALMVAATWTTEPGLVVLVLPLAGALTLVSRRHITQDAIFRDAKTRLLNAAGWRDRAERVLSRSSRTRSPTGVLMVDLDHFKRVNDTWGHVAGDAVLAEVARVLRDTVRGKDEVGRFGGEEFVVLLPGADETGASLAAERIRAAVAASSVLLGDGTEVRVTASVGVASGCGAETVDAILERADRGVYAAKESGRDAVRVGSANDTVPSAA